MLAISESLRSSMRCSSPVAFLPMRPGDPSGPLKSRPPDRPRISVPVIFLQQQRKVHRKLAKAVNFGLLYGMGAKGLQSYALKSYGVEMSLEQTSLYRRRFFETYPGLKRWHDSEGRAWQRGDAETLTLTGRRRMDVDKFTDRLNAPVQGTAADGLKLALAFLWERRGECPGAMPVLVCHDEVVVECTAEQAVDTKAWLEKAMIEGMNAILRSAGDVRVSVEVEDR